MALGREKKTLELYDDTTGVFHFTTSNKEYLKKTLKDLSLDQEIIKTITVAVEPVSQKPEIQRLERIDLVKIDAEGAEQEILEDLRPLYPKIKIVILEYHMVEGLKNNSFDAIYNILSEYKFRVYVAGFYRNLENLTNPNVFMIMAKK